MNTICTISTQSHLFKTYALAESIKKYGVELKVLLIDTDAVQKDFPDNIQFHFLNNIHSDRIEKTKQRYKKDKLRWALKPAYLLYLLSSHNRIIYVDNDVFFYKKFEFLFHELKDSDVLLTPHFYPNSPTGNQTWLEANFRIGLYNAGFIGVNNRSKNALEWWSDCCLYAMKIAYWRGLFVDQKYLDLFPILFNNVKVLKQKGCNFAGWNEHLKLTEKEITFIHYNPFTLQKFSNGKNKYNSMFREYELQLKRFNPKFRLKTKLFNSFKMQNGMYYIKWKISQFISNAF